MKKIVLTIVALLSMSLSYASNIEKDAKGSSDVVAVNMNQIYDMSVNYTRLAVALKLYDYEQYQSVKNVHEQFVHDMNKVAEAAEGERAAMVKKLANKELRNMRYVLDDDQYRRYCTLLNLTLSNRGLLK